MPSPNPNRQFPLSNYDGLVFLKNVIKSPLIEVGDYTYFDDPAGAENFEKRNVLYHFDFIGDRLVIGRYCAIAREVHFLMNGANHSLAGFSTYPFYIFGDDWEAFPPPKEPSPVKGDTIIGHDVWIGYGATILPGVQIGNGAIIGSRAVVASDVEPYAIVAGNPAKVIRKRFPEQTVAMLEKIAWWDWPVEKVTEHLKAISTGDQIWLQNQSNRP